MSNIYPGDIYISKKLPVGFRNKHHIVVIKNEENNFVTFFHQDEGGLLGNMEYKWGIDMFNDYYREINMEDFIYKQLTA